jgi:hypothetical protein
MGFSAVISALDRSERHLGDGPWNRHSYFIASGPAVDGDSNRFGAETNTAILRCSSDGIRGGAQVPFKPLVDREFLERPDI